MARHAFSNLRAHLEPDGVRISCYLTTPVFSAQRDDADTIRIRVHRQSVPRFRWGQDYAEYFDGMDARRATVVFDGSVCLINRRKVEFLDSGVRTGVTYVYWVSTSQGRLRTGPVPIRVRDSGVWWSHAEVMARLRTIAEGHPGLASLTRYGTTAGGREIGGLILGNRDNLVALVGTIHAGESGPELVIPAVERLLRENRALFADVGVGVLPNVNVDERERLVDGCAWYLRTNARGVDINRNFAADWDRVEYGYGLVSDDPDAATYRGPQAESEPETQAVVRFLRDARPRAVFSYHCLASITGACFLGPRDGEGDDAFVKACHAFADPYVGAFHPACDSYGGVRFGASAGSLPAYAYRVLGVPGFDLEWDGAPDAKPSHTDKTTPKLLHTYQERHYRGLLATLEKMAASPGS
jgi:hypothetical protein